MVDQVTFPPSIGGTGKTYTSDANPETGVFGGAHRVNFFPMIGEVVGVGVYVSQYAQAIAGAKANADRAEDAKGYVEAVADALEINALESVKRQATLDLDFVRGSYRRDDGVLKETKDPFLSGVGEVQSGTGLLLQGVDGHLMQTGIDEIGRVWDGGHPVGFAVFPDGRNQLLHNRNLSEAGWSTLNCTVTLDNSEKSPDGTEGEVYKLVSDDNPPGDSYVGRVEIITVGGSGFYGLYTYIKSAGATEVEVRHASVQFNRVIFNLETESFVFSSDNANQEWGYERLRDGWYKIWTIDQPTIDTGIIRIAQRNSRNGVDGIYIWNPQVQSSSVLAPPIGTTTTPVSTSPSGCDFSLGTIKGSVGFSAYIEVSNLNAYFEGGYNYIFFLQQYRDSTAGEWVGAIVERISDSELSLTFRSSITTTLRDVALLRPVRSLKMAISVYRDKLLMSVNGKELPPRIFDYSALVDSVAWGRVGGTTGSASRPSFNCERLVITPSPLVQSVLNEVTAK
ncbi:hypothetical protein ACE3G8_03815 [Vreelandella venusta]